MRTDLIQSTVRQLLEQFAKQEFGADVGWQIIRRRKGDSPIPSDSWSSGNRWIMLSHGSTDCRSMGCWNKAGRRVIKGSHAIYICAPITRTVKSEDIKDDTRTVIAGFRWQPVFRLSDTSGSPIPVIDYTPNKEDLPSLLGVAEKLGIEVKWQPFNGRALGIYKFGTNEVYLAEKSNLTLAHEVCHFLDFKTNAVRGDIATAELVAEFGACVILSITKGSTEGHTGSIYSYLQMYSKGKNPEAVLKAIMTVANRVETVVTLFLDAAESITDANTTTETTAISA